MPRIFWVLLCWVIALVALVLVAFEITGGEEKGIMLVPFALAFFVLGWIIDRFPPPAA